MQPKFTLKKIAGFFRLCLLIFSFGLAGISDAQTVTTASGTNYNGDYGINPASNPGTQSVSFVLENTTAAPLALTTLSSQLGAYFGQTGTTTTKLLASTTSLSGPYDISTAAWTVVNTGSATLPVITTAPVVTVTNSGMNYIIAAGAQVRFVLEVQKGLAFSFNPVPTPNSFTSGGVTLRVGNNQIAGANVGYIAVNGNSGTANTPIFFGGSATLVSTSPCSGTPNPGNTVPSSAAVCSNANFTLTTANATPGSGVTYQWQSASVVGGPYTDISGGTNATLTTSQTVATFYRVVVTCSGNSGTSTPIQVTMNALTSCYCTAGGTSALDEKIAKVEFNTISNSSIATTPYEDFTNLTTTVVKGQTLPITVTLALGYSGDQTIVWIDYNQNGVFTDAGETVFTSPQSAGPHTGNITIPTGALTGPTRMRVRMHDAVFGPNATSCGNASYGQVEDYTINIQPCVQGVITTNPTAKSVQCSGNTTFSVVATGSALTYSWQYRVSATSAWLTVPNAAPYSNVTTATLGINNASASLSGYEYRALVSGPCTAIIFSGGGVLTVTPLIATVTPTSASICLGSIQKITLTNASSPVTSVFSPSSGLPLVIPDGNTTGVSTTSVVSGIPAGAIVTDVSITLNIAHTWVGDIVANLTAPNGQTINLIGALDAGAGNNSTDNFTGTIISSTGVTALSGAAAPRTGTFKADLFTATVPTIAPTTGNTWAPLLSTLNGNWKLSLCDRVSIDAGSVISWSVSITYGAPATGVWTSVPATPNTIFTDAAATVPYVAGAQAGDIYVKPTVNTTYSVVYTTPAPSGCTSAATTVPVTVVTPATAPTITPATRVACVGGSTTFTAAATGGPFTYQWEVNTTGGTPTGWTPITGATSATLTLTALTAVMTNNQYRAVITAGPCAGSVTTAASTLTVNPIPVITISAPVTQLIPGRSTTITATSTTPGLVYTFTRNNVATNVAGSSQFVTIDSLGTYRVTGTLTGLSGCTGTSNALVIGTEASETLFIYPNPTDGVFQVRLFQLTDFPTRREVSVYNSYGQMVAHKSFDFIRGMSPYYKMDFDLSRLAPGTYIVKATEKNTTRIVSGLVVIQ